MFIEEISLTGRVLLSAANDKCSRGSSRAADSKGMSHKGDKNAEDLHVGSRGMVCVCWCSTDSKRNRSINDGLMLRPAENRTTRNGVNGFCPADKFVEGAK